jgi:hypothetical protein
VRVWPCWELLEKKDTYKSFWRALVPVEPGKRPRSIDVLTSNLAAVWMLSQHFKMVTYFQAAL